LQSYFEIIIPLVVIIFFILLYRFIKNQNHIIELTKLDTMYELLNETQSLVNVGSFYRDLHKDYVWFSKENYHIWDIGEKKVVKLTALLNKIDSNYKELFLSKIDQQSSSNNIDKFQFKIYVNGQVKYIESTIRYEANEKGKITCVKGTHQDITQKILFLEEMQKLMKENEKYKTRLEDKVKEQIREIKGKDDTLLANNKKVALAEMVANIAHQWREPLAIISATTTGLIVKKKGDVLNDDDLYTNLHGINQKVQYLSKTIDTFKNFIHNEKIKKEYDLKQNIESALLIVSSYINQQHIEIKKEFPKQEIKLELIEGELIEVLINVINNARDVLLERKVKNPWIKIIVTKSTNNAIISIEDNGGGIRDIDSIMLFDQKGIGLRISHKLITQSIGGKFYAKNSENGAKFFIELPLK